jgi:arylsulfatase A-like enzyme
VNKKYISKEQLVEGHIMITSVAMNYFKKEKPLFTFIYYGYPDETSQSKSLNTKEYYQAINDIDTEIGKIVDGIKEAGLEKSTTIIVTSDHGSIGLAHGNESTVEIEVPWIISGPGIKKNMLLESPNDQANTAPTLAKILALKTPPDCVEHASMVLAVTALMLPRSVRFRNMLQNLRSGSLTSTEVELNLKLTACLFKPPFKRRASRR